MRCEVVEQAPREAYSWEYGERGAERTTSPEGVDGAEARARLGRSAGDSSRIGGVS